QNDAEVGVGADDLASSPNSGEDRFADEPRWCRFHLGSDGGGAHQEIKIVCILKVAMTMNVAQLGSGDFPDAGKMSAEADGKHDRPPLRLIQPVGPPVPRRTR